MGTVECLSSRARTEGPVLEATHVATRSHARPTPSEVLLALLLAVAAGVHGTLFPEHARASVLLGVGFAVTGALQLAAAVAVLVRPSRRLVAAVAVGSAGAILAWAAARTVGLPFGPDPWRPEAVGPVDALTALVEVAALWVAALMHTGGRGASRIERAAPAAAWVAGAVGVFTLALSAEHGGHAGAGGRHLAGHVMHAALVVAVVAWLPLLGRLTRRRSHRGAHSSSGDPLRSVRSGDAAGSGGPAQNGGGSLAGNDSSDAWSTRSSVDGGATSSSERR
jgi:hypothetical protein